MSSGYAQYFCGVCRQKQPFKILPRDRDEHGRTLMVCTRCNSKKPVPGQAKRDM